MGLNLLRGLLCLELANKLTFVRSQVDKRTEGWPSADLPYFRFSPLSSPSLLLYDTNTIKEYLKKEVVKIFIFVCTYYVLWPSYVSVIFVVGH